MKTDRRPGLAARLTPTLLACLLVLTACSTDEDSAPSSPPRTSAAPPDHTARPTSTPAAPTTTDAGDSAHASKPADPVSGPTSPPTPTSSTGASASAPPEDETGAPPAGEQPPEPPAGLPDEWGVALVAEDGSVQTLGPLQEGAAWSTIKVPLSIAALRAHGTADQGLVDAAITRSDNAAAEALWSGLGEPAAAGAAVDEALADHGDTTTRTQTRQVHPPYSAFGQTSWTLGGQVRFGTSVACAQDPASVAVVDSMGRIVSDQAWGLGRLDGAAFKGGWGPGTDGRYLVRQMGLVTVEGRRYAVALAARAADGSFAGGIAALDTLAAWLPELLADRAAPITC